MRDATFLLSDSLFNIAFQSTRPMRDATLVGIFCNSYPFYFNPRVPCGTRHFLFILKNISFISIHASHAGRDSLFFSFSFSIIFYFNPRVPCGTRRICKSGVVVSRKISIHASHAGRDFVRFPPTCVLIKFQSTRPMRDATAVRVVLIRLLSFQSTRPMRDATHHTPTTCIYPMLFQSTRPMRDATMLDADHLKLHQLFQSTRPMRDATILPYCFFLYIRFQSTRPMRDATFSLTDIPVS